MALTRAQQIYLAIRLAATSASLKRMGFRMAVHLACLIAKGSWMAVHLAQKRVGMLASLILTGSLRAGYLEHHWSREIQKALMMANPFQTELRMAFQTAEMMELRMDEQKYLEIHLVVMTACQTQMGFLKESKTADWTRMAIRMAFQRAVLMGLRMDFQKYSEIDLAVMSASLKQMDSPMADCLAF